MNNSSSDKQQLQIVSAKWTIDLVYTKGNLLADSDKQEIDNYAEISLSDTSVYNGHLKIKISNSLGKRTCVLREIFGSVFLEKQNDSGGQTVKLIDDALILSMGVHLISLDLNNLSLNWHLQPDLAEVFEFYDLESDLLLRGEIDIHRIDLNGKKRWSFSGADIWVNMYGKPEVQIKENHIELLDYNSKKYLINFEGKEI